MYKGDLPVILCQILYGLIWYLIDTIPSTRTFLKNEKCYPYPLIFPTCEKSIGGH